MSKFLIIFKQEYTQVVKKKSFLVGLIITPLFLFGMMFGPALLAKKKASSTEHLAIIDQSSLQIGEKFKEKIGQYKLEDETTPYYEVEKIFDIPGGDETPFKKIDDSLKKLILEDDLKYMLVITPEAMSSDSGIYVVASADNIVSYQRFEWQFSQIISAERLQQSNINLPVDSVLNLTSRIDLITKDVTGETVSLGNKMMIAIVFVMMIYMLVLINGQMVMRSVIDEKNSRIMEVLVSSVSPFQIMMGKIFGLGMATLTQVLIWILAGVGFMMFGGAMAGDSAVVLQKVVFNPYILIYFVIYLVLGFLLYSAIFALLGSIVENEKEAQNFIFPIVILLIIPIGLSMLVLQDPNGTIPTVISFIPFCTPTMMVMRLNILLPGLPEYNLLSGPLLQANMTVLILIAAVIGMIWITSKVFRVGILMYGKRATLPEIIKWVKH